MVLHAIKIRNDWSNTFSIRDGVEDTRLEAKDTKKPKAKDSPSEDRPSRGQGQECSRTQAQVFSEKIGLQKTFSDVLHKKKKGLQKFVPSDLQNFN